MGYFLCACLSWVFPGLGHLFYSRNRGRSIALALLILLTFFLGYLLCDFRTIEYNFTENPFFYLSQFGSLFFLLAHRMFLSVNPQGMIPGTYWDVGVLYYTAAGYLNFLSLIYLIPNPAPVETEASLQPETIQE